MDIQTITYSLLGLLAIWTIVLTFFVIKINKHFKTLTKDVKDVNLIKVLEHVLEKEKANANDIKKVEQEIELINQDIKRHVQKVGFVRFNPFAETGGDQSFALSLLDKELTGYIITGLHSRDKTRIYVKPIEKGKCKFKLSKEEKKAVTNAKK